MNYQECNAHTVKELIIALQFFPEDAKVLAYEGEITAIVVRSADDKNELGYIETRSA